MKIAKVKVLIITLVLISGVSNSQGYAPKLNNHFLEGTKSIFNKETEFFRFGLRKCLNNLFYTKIDGYSPNGSDYDLFTLSIIPRNIFETNFFIASVKLKMNVENSKEFQFIPITYQAYLNGKNEDGSIKKGNGEITIEEGKMSLQFAKSLIRSTAKNLKSEFSIDKVKYSFENNIFEIELYGQFNSGIKIKKDEIPKDTTRPYIRILVEKGNLSLFVVTEEKEIKIIDKAFTKDDFKE